MSSSTPPTPVVCPRCGHTVGAEQSWCLSCGAPARTRMRPTPNWRLPVATIAATVLVVAGGTLGAFVALTTTSDDPSAATPATTAAPAAPVTPAVPEPDPQPTAPATTPTATTTPTTATTPPTTSTGTATTPPTEGGTATGTE